MQGLTTRLVFLVWAVWCLAPPAFSQAPQEETLGGPDSHETGLGPHGHLLEPLREELAS